MSKKKKTLIAVFAILGIAVVGLSVGVIAKYVSNITATGTAKVAKWAFTDDNTSGNIECELDYSYDEETLVDGVIAPGTSGKCPIVISNKSSEVGITYTIEPVGDVANKPTNLVFYQDAGHQQAFDSTHKISGTLEPGEEMDENDPVYVYWNWAYETTDGDDEDTADGEQAQTMTMQFKVTGTQIAPAH